MRILLLLTAASVLAAGLFCSSAAYAQPILDDGASVRMQVTPKQTEVFIDNRFVGTVDDFDGIFQRLNVAPGRHEIALRLDGYQTWTAEVFATPDSTLNLRHQMVPGPSEPYDEGDRRGVSAGPDGPEGPDGPPEYEPPQ